MAPEYLPISLMDMPDELLLQIIGYLHVIRSDQPQSQAFKLKEEERARQCENGVRQKTLHALCLTSRSLKRISEPILYSAFLGSSTWRGYSPIRRFQKTILKRRELAARVRYVENRLSDYLGNGLYNDMELYGAVEMVEEYFSKLASIIILAENTEHLSVVSLETSEVSLWSKLVHNEVSSLIAYHGFPKLQTLCLQIQTGDYGLSDGAAWFQRICDDLTKVPTLRSLRASGVVGSDLYHSFTGMFENLDTVEISECILDFEEVEQLTSACKNLKHFSCQWAFLNCHVSDQPSDLFPGLLLHKDSLETLHLDLRETRHHPESLAPQPLGSFREFHVLKSIVICESTLLTTRYSILDFPHQHLSQRIAELLPTHLEFLTLLLQSDHGYTNDFTVDEALALWALAEDCENLLPSLKEVNIKSGHVIAGPNLTKEFKKVGVDLRFMEEK
jgi:hypothetical protein